MLVWALRYYIPILWGTTNTVVATSSSSAYHYDSDIPRTDGSTKNHYYQQEDLYRLETIRTCLDSFFTSERNWGTTNNSTITSTNHDNQNPSIVRTIPHSDDEAKNRTILIELRNAIRPDQAESIVALSDCAATAFPLVRSHRAFGEGGNEVTFLNILLQMFLPDVTETVYRIAHLAQTAAVGWSGPDHPPTKDCGLRTTEYLNYHGYKSLGDHDDAGSLYTVIFALSDPSSYEGGEFYIREQPRSSRVHALKPEQFSAFVFLSEKWHGVMPLTGDRQMFTNELWIHADPPWKRFRPCRESMAHFTERFEAAAQHNNNMDNEVMTWETMEALWPRYDETVQWFDETNQEWTLDGHVNREYYRDFAGPYAAEQYERRFAHDGLSSSMGAAAGSYYASPPLPTGEIRAAEERRAASPPAQTLQQTLVNQKTSTTLSEL
jgi:2OG-Fe(II) oxygenase superfamily